jgi:hypothetical protein
VAALVSWPELQRIERLEEEHELTLVAAAKQLLAREGAVPFARCWSSTPHCTASRWSCRPSTTLAILPHAARSGTVWRWD